MYVEMMISREKPKYLENTFSLLVCHKFFNNQVKYNQDSYLLLEYILIHNLHLSSGYCSYRDKQAGSWFIQRLCTELQKHASAKDFLKILTRTSYRVAVDCETYKPMEQWMHQKKQVPSFTSMLIRDLFFRSKISQIK